MSAVDVAILRALRAEPHHAPAGELAAQIGVPLEELQSRLEELRGAGFVIEEHPRAGVRLLNSPDRLISDDLRSRLGECPLIREVLVFAETDSTNNRAADAGRCGAAGGLAIFAEKQSAGRGRFGRRWESAPHLGLWFSLLLRPELEQAHWPRLTTWSAVCLARALDRFAGVATEIKWPNDLLLGGKKVAGILIETGQDDAQQPFAVVGAGVNVNHAPQDFPPELAHSAASIRQAAGGGVDRPALAAAILKEIDAGWRQLHDEFSSIIEEATQRSALLGEWVQVRVGEMVIAGAAEALDPEGQLLVRVNGELRAVNAGEATIVRETPAL